MTMIDSDLIKKSVTREEVEQLGPTAVFFRPMGDTPLVTSLPYTLPMYWTPRRDITLWGAYIHCGLWASAVHIASTRIATLGYDVESKFQARAKDALAMLNRDWAPMASSIARDWCTTDNGAFIEVVRASKSPGSKMLGLLPLSSFRCWRTGDPEIPVQYMDRLGRLHDLQAHQVAAFSDMPQQLIYGVGLSATSRVYDKIYEHMAVAAYFKEKATGRKPQSLYLVAGIRQETINKAMADAQAQADVSGNIARIGAAIWGDTGSESVSMVEIPFAALPDWFDQTAHQQEVTIEFATALGIDPTDLDPRLIGNRSLGAGSQAQVLQDKQDSKGMISLREQLLHFFNDEDRWHPLNRTTFSWSEKDLSDQKAKADIAKTRADTRAAQIASGEITPEIARQLAVKDGDLPEEVVADPNAFGESLNQTDKPADGQQAPAAQVDAAQAALQPTQPQGDLVTIKATEVLSMAVPKSGKRGPMSSAEEDYLKAVAKDFAEYGRIFTQAAQPLIPQATGETARSLRWQVEQKGTRTMTLKVYVGNANRPEVAIRSVLFGRHPIHAKGKALEFQIGGKTIYAKYVSGAKAQDWVEKAMNMTRAQRESMQRNMDMQTVDNVIDVADVPGAKKITTAAQTKVPRSWMKRKKKAK